LFHISKQIEEIDVKCRCYHGLHRAKKEFPLIVNRVLFVLENLAVSCVFQAKSGVEKPDCPCQRILLVRTRPLKTFSASSLSSPFEPGELPVLFLVRLSL
jgi:hypothetical protein